MKSKSSYKYYCNNIIFNSMLLLRMRKKVSFFFFIVFYLDQFKIRLKTVCFYFLVIMKVKIKNFPSLKSYLFKIQDTKSNCINSVSYLKKSLEWNFLFRCIIITLGVFTRGENAISINETS